MGLLGKSGATAVVGLDIGAELIKVAEAKLSKNGIEITGLGVSPTPAGAIDNSIVTDPKALGSAVKQLLKEAGIKTKTVVSAISGQFVVVRVIEVPKMTGEELADTMKWEVERHVPFAPTEIVMDFAPVEKPSADPNAQSMEVLLAVAQEDAVNTHVETLFAAGLTPMAIDVQPLAVSRALIDLGNGSGSHAVAIVNIGSSTTDVGVFEDGLLAFPGPPTNIGGVNFTRAICEALGVPLEEADRLKKELTSIDPQAIHSLGVPAASPDAGYALGGEPTSFDTFYQQPDVYPEEHAAPAEPVDTAPAAGATSGPDFSPFDFGPGAPPPPPPPAEAKPLDISAEDVFDLGSGQTQQQDDFKPVFDLDEDQVVSPTPTPAPTADFAAPQEPTVPADDMQTMQSYPEDGVPVAQPYDIDGAVSDAITPVLIELATEIRRSLDYYATRYQKPIDQIFLCGGTARMRGLDQFLANELGVPVVVADPLSNLNVNCPKYSAQYLSDISPFFPVSVGLAIREMME